jgi:hypothetical protein
MGRDKEGQEKKTAIGLKFLERKPKIRQHFRFIPPRPQLAPGGFCLSRRLEKFRDFQTENVRQGAGFIGPGPYAAFKQANPVLRDTTPGRKLRLGQFPLDAFNFKRGCSHFSFLLKQ